MIRMLQICCSSIDFGIVLNKWSESKYSLILASSYNACLEIWWYFFHCLLFAVIKEALSPQELLKIWRSSHCCLDTLICVYFQTSFQKIHIRAALFVSLFCSCAVFPSALLDIQLFFKTSWNYIDLTFELHW